MFFLIRRPLIQSWIQIGKVEYLRLWLCNFFSLDLLLFTLRCLLLWLSFWVFCVCKRDMLDLKLGWGIRYFNESAELFCAVTILGGLC